MLTIEEMAVMWPEAHVMTNQQRIITQVSSAERYSSNVITGSSRQLFLVKKQLADEHRGAFSS